MMKQLAFLLLLSGLLNGSLFAQNISVTAAVDKNRILIGEPLQLTLTAVKPKGSGPGWFAVDSFAHFEIMEQSTLDSQVKADAVILRQTFTLTSWDSGRWQVPSFPLGRARTKPLPIDVGHTPMERDQPYNDIKDIIDVQKPEASNWWWYLIGLALLIVLFLLFFPKGKGQPQTPQPLPKDMYREALNQLNALRAQDEPRYLYTELIHIFRNYLEKRKGIQSLSKTTDDLSVQIKSLSLPEAQYRSLVQVLQGSDMVKFARFVPRVEDNEQAIEVIKQNIISIENLR